MLLAFSKRGTTPDTGKSRRSAGVSAARADQIDTR